MKHNQLTITPVQAEEIITGILQAGLVPMLAGSPAIGKSSVVKKIAKDFGMKLIDLRLPQCDPTDLLGFPTVDKEANKASYMPMSTFPIEGDEIPEGFNGWLLFLDELTSADRGVQKAAYKLLLDRQVGEFNLHDKVLMVCAGNLATDNALVEEMSTALQSRLIHLEMASDWESWIKWAQSNGIDHRVTSFIKFKPDLLNKFDPDSSNSTYPSPRTWDFVSKLLAVTDINNTNILPLLAGTVSQGPAIEFLSFTKLYAEIPSIPEILKAPSSIEVPEKKSVLFALTGAIAAHVTTGNIGKLIVFINRLPKEFQVICIREIHARNPEIISGSPEIQTWFQDNTSELF